MSDKSTRIVILGAGYGGMMAALRLAGKTRRQNIDITLVNASDHFVERLRLHEWATHRPLKDRPIRSMLSGTRVNFVQGKVTALEPSQRMVHIETEAGSQQLTYDRLIYALGTTIERENMPGARQNAYTMSPQGPRSAEALRTVLPALAKSGGRVMVVGGGLTGIESAAQIKGVYPGLAVGIVTEGELGVFPNRFVQDYMRQSLLRRHVEIHEHQRVIAVEARELRLANGSTMPFDVCVWAGGFQGHSLVAEAGLAANERGRILVDPYLRSITFPEIFVVGDAAQPTTPTGAPPRMSAVFALTTGAHAANNLIRVMNDQPQKAFGFSTFGQGIALGPNDTVAFNSFPNDRPVGPIFRGKFAADLRSFFANMLMALFVLERRLPGSFTWFGKNRHAPVSVAPVREVMPTPQP